jgi:protein required for attachment to host cells
MTRKSWLVLANGSLARFFNIEKRGTFKEILLDWHVESRKHMLDLVSDKPGRAFDSNGAGRHGLEPQTSPKEKEEIIFANILAEHLKSAFNNKEFNRLYISAGPHFLGLLREKLDKHVMEHIIEQQNKDLTHLSLKEIEQYYADAY